MGWWGGGPWDFSVSPSPFGLDFGTLDFGTSDLGLTISIRYLLQLGDGFICETLIIVKRLWTGTGNGKQEIGIGMGNWNDRRCQYNLTGQGLTLSTQLVRKQSDFVIPSEPKILRLVLLA